MDDENEKALIKIWRAFQQWLIANPKQEFEFPKLVVYDDGAGRVSTNDGNSLRVICSWSTLQIGVDAMQRLMRNEEMDHEL